MPLRENLIRLATHLFGKVCLIVFKVARRTEIRLQLSHCNEVGERVSAGYDLIVDNGGRVTIGADVSFMNRCILNTYRGGSIRIGDSCFFGDNCKVISDIGHISIGQGCLIAEDVVIRAANHGARKGTPIRFQENHVKDVTIGNDVWIGRGVTVLPGAVIADGCVIGANSVVRGVTDANAFYAGVPIRKLKDRPDGDGCGDGNYRM